ncbi:MAG: hypothetical protein H7X95_08030 [Deltaproteobacteria bacterium]|nr:hypothetical protein [Deltaproteobacteria bacterium]
MRKSRTSLSSLLSSLLLGFGFIGLVGIACQNQPAPKSEPVAAVPAAAPIAPPIAQPPAPPGDAAAVSADGAVTKKSKLGPAPTDGLSLAERMERRKADDTKLAAQLAADERQRLLVYDRTKVKLHKEVFAFIQKTRAALDGAKSKADVEKLQKKLEKPIVATGKKLQKIDPKGGNSNVVTDYDVMLNALANEYPQALIESFDGVKPALAEQRAELDKRTKKIEEWLRALKGGK